MARPKKNKETPGAPAVQVHDPAPGYAPPAGAPMPAYGGATPGATTYPGYGPMPGGNGAGAVPTPPPPRNNNTFVNAQFLWSLQRPVVATLTGVRGATGGNAQYGNKKGWFLDCKLETGQDVTARINEGDQRHTRLWAAYQANWIGKQVVLRLSNPGDATKAPWTLDPR